MLSLKQKLAKRLVRLRLANKLSQKAAAELAEFSQPYLAQVEKGTRPISGRALARLEMVYGKKLGKLWNGIGRRGRPAFSHSTKLAMLDFAGAVREFWEVGGVQVPRYPQPHQVLRAFDPLWPIALHLGSAAREEVELLERLRLEDESFWRQFNSLRFDSWSEKRLLVRVALLGGQLLGVRLARLGCSLRLVDGTTGERARLHRGFVLKGQKASLVWCPQVAVQTEAGLRCVDNLLVVSRRGLSVTMAVEVEGRDYHLDRERERRRDRALGIPVLHVDAGELEKPGLLKRILQWAYEQFEGSVA